MADFQRLNPLAFYETPKEVCPVLNKFVSLGVAANQTVITAVTGKRIRVMGIIAQSNNAASGTLSLLDGSGGTALFTYPLPTNAQPAMQLPIANPGYMETTTGNGLFATVTVQAIIANIFYIVYTP